MKDLVSKQGEVNEIIDEGNQIIEDKGLLEGERRIAHEKMIALHNDWNKLATLTSGKQQRLATEIYIRKVWGNKAPDSPSEFTAFGFLLEYQNVRTTDSKQGNTKLTAQKCYVYYFLFNLFIFILILIILFY